MLASGTTPLESMKSPGHDVQLNRNARLHESMSIFNVFERKQIDASDADKYRRQTTQVCDPRRAELGGRSPSLPALEQRVHP